MLLKKSDVEIPKDLPENTGFLMFLWKKDNENNPSMTWDNMTGGNWGDACQILMQQLLLISPKNMDTMLEIMLYTKKKIEDERLQNDNTRQNSQETKETVSEV
jgi:hypothetical protein